MRITTLFKSCAGSFIALAISLPIVQAQDPKPVGDVELLEYWDFEADDGGTVAGAWNGRVGTLIGDAVIADGGRFGNALDTSAGAGAALAVFDGDPEDAEGAGWSEGKLIADANVDASFFEEIIEKIAVPDQLSITYWQRNVDARKNMNSFWLVSPAAPGGGGGNRGAQAHTPWSNGTIFFDTAGCCGADTRVSGETLEDDVLMEWNHFAFIKNGEMKEVWHNGERVLDGSGAAPFYEDFAGLYIGNGIEENFNQPGFIDEFGLISGALSEEQIKELADGALVIDIFDPSDPNFAVGSVKNYGQLPAVSGAQELIFSFKNTGDTQPLNISSAEIISGDTDHFTLTSFPEMVGPEETAAFVLSFESKNQFRGFEVMLEVKTDDPDEEDQTVTIPIRAFVKNPLGPTIHYPLNETDGTVAVDATGEGNDGAYEGAILGQEGLNASTGTSVRFSGGSQLTGPGNDFESFSVSLLMNVETLGDLGASDFKTILAQGEANPGFGLLLAGGELIWFGEIDGVPDALFLSEGAPIAANTTYHVFMTYDSATKVGTIIVDGNEVASGDVGDLPDFADASLYLGAFNGVLAMDGRLDELQIYPRVLSADEMSTLMANPGQVIVPDPEGEGIDTDEDGLTDEEELAAGTNFENPDTDGDGLLDGAEVKTHGTNPLSDDSDGDEFTDPFELAQGSDPTNPNSTPGGIGQPDLQITEIGPFATMEANGWDTKDATFRLHVDFDAKTDGGPEVLFESGGATVGLSLVYEAGNKLVIRQVGNGGNDVGVLEYSLTDAEVAAGELEVIWTTQINNGDGMQVLRLFIDGAEAASLTAALQADWTGANGAALGTSSSAIAAAGGNTSLADTIDFASGTINTVSGLEFFSDLLFVPTPAGFITWEAPDLDTTVGDLIGGPSITFVPFAYDGGNADGTFWTGDGGTTGDEMLDAVYNSHGWNGDGASITLEGLTEGESYQVQLLGAGDTRGCCNTRNQAGSDGTNVSGDFPRGNSSVIGTFVAPGSTHEVMIISGQDNGVDPGLSGFILTDADGGLIAAFNVGRTEGDDIIVMTGEGPSGPPLIAHFPLDANGNSADGNFVASTETDITYGAAGANGNTGTSATFNGTSSVIQHDWSTDLNPESFTLALWARSDGGAGTWNSPVTSRHDLFNDGEMSQGYLIYDNQPAGVWTFWSGNGPVDGNWQTLDGPAVNLGEWEHLAITYDNATETKRLYVNGELAVESNDSITPNDTTPFNIGSGQDFGTGFRFVGDIDDIGLWGGALDQAAIQGVMADGVASYSGGGGGGERLASLENVGIQASGAFGVSLPEGVTADIEYSTDLINWEVIATGISGAVEETDADRMAAPAGFYRAKQ